MTAIQSVIRIRRAFSHRPHFVEPCSMVVPRSSDSFVPIVLNRTKWEP